MRNSIISVLLLALTVCTGCDSLRKLAGRPTSADIEIKRAEIVRMKEIEHKIMMDSLAVVEKQISDSLAKADSLAEVQEAQKLSKAYQAKGTIANPARMGGLFTTKLDYKYYVVVGAFSNRQNAEKQLKIVQDAGYTATIISFRNGFNAIGMCQTDDLNSALASLKKVSQEPFCPVDAWIMVNE